MKRKKPRTWDGLLGVYRGKVVAVYVLVGPNLQAIPWERVNVAEHVRVRITEVLPKPRKP